MTYRVAQQYALIDDGSATSDFVSREQSTRNSETTAERLLLGSGFKSSSTDSRFPVSAALQLNGDLTELTDAQLKAFADAELEKHNNISFRSYDVDADYRVCVIADDPKRLDDFFETYGGMLEIEPLLIGSYHRDYATIDEVDIISAAKGYTINYTVKSPINQSRCTYCGICGAICPERCILENLYFDFSRCTYCNECVKACPVEAIDLYSIERITLDIPALIVLGKPAFTEPDDTGSLYAEAQLGDFLATIYSCRVDEVITCNTEICHFNGTGEAGCTACLSACKFDAVRAIDKEIRIDAFSCTECGICAAVCPTGALQNRKLTDQMFIDFFRTFDLPAHTRVIIGADHDLHRFWWLNNQKHYPGTLFFEIPGDHSFTLLQLLFLISHGAGQLVILGNDTGLSPDLQRTISDANLVCSKMLGIKQVVSLVSSYDDLAENFVPDNVQLPGSRYNDLSFVNRRRKLSSVVHYLSSAADLPIAFAGDEMKDWGTVVCDEQKCTQCLACLNVCKVESLSADQENLALCWNGGLCISCGGCVATCPENALILKGGIEISAGFFNDNEVARAEPMCCKSCGKVFGTKKSYDRVIALLTEKQGTPPDHLQYCDDCRVLKLMESQ